MFRRRDSMQKKRYRAPTKRSAKSIGLKVSAAVTSVGGPSKGSKHHDRTAEPLYGLRLAALCNARRGYFRAHRRRGTSARPVAWLSANARDVAPDGARTCGTLHPRDP